MSASEICPCPLSKEWVDQIKKNIEEDQAALNRYLKDCFNNLDLDGIERALVAGADPNLLVYYSPKPDIFSEDGFSVTLMDIIEKGNFFEGEQRDKAHEIFTSYGACTTEEGTRAFGRWTKKGLSLIAPKKRASHKNCLVEIVFILLSLLGDLESRSFGEAF